MTVAANLQAQLTQLEKLLGTLARERELIGAGTVDGTALADVAREKQVILDALSRIDHEHTGFLDHPVRDERAAREHGCIALWRNVHEHARHAARANQFNGDLIHARLISNQRLLNDLHGLARKNLYGPDGQATGSRPRVSSHA